MTQINDHAEWPKFYLSGYAKRPNRPHPDPDVAGVSLTVMFSENRGAWPRDLHVVAGVAEPSWAAWTPRGGCGMVYTQPDDQLPYELGLKYLAKYRHAANAENLLPDWFRQQLEEAARDQNQ